MNPLAPARGILLGFLLGLLCWGVVALVLAVYVGQSTWTTLGQRAVLEGVIP